MLQLPLLTMFVTGLYQDIVLRLHVLENGWEIRGCGQPVYVSLCVGV